MQLNHLTHSFIQQILIDYELCAWPLGSKFTANVFEKFLSNKLTKNVNKQMKPKNDMIHENPVWYESIKI